jgi:hypothetical protein
LQLNTLFGLSFQQILGYVFYPLAWLIGIPLSDALNAGSAEPARRHAGGNLLQLNHRHKFVSDQLGGHDAAGAINALFATLFGLSFQQILGYVFYPLAWLIGIPLSDNDTRKTERMPSPRGVMLAAIFCSSIIATNSLATRLLTLLQSALSPGRSKA